MIVAGIDPSITGTGLAVVARHPGAVTTRRVVTTPDRPLIERMRIIVGEAVAFCDLAELVVIEGLSMGSHGNATRDLAGLWWLLVDALTAKERLRPRKTVGVVAPSTLKLWATGHGKASKAAMREHMEHRWNLPRKPRISTDEADALALAGMGLHHSGRLPWVPTVAQERAVATARWPEEAAA